MKTYPVCTRHSSFNAQCFNCYQVADSLERNREQVIETKYFQKQAKALTIVFDSRNTRF